MRMVGSRLDLLAPWLPSVLITLKYSAITDLYNLQFIIAHALRFSVSTSRLLARDLNTETSTSNHYEVFLPFLVQSLWNSTKNSPGLLTLLNSKSNFLWLSPTKNCTVVPMVFKITPLHRPHRKHRLLVLRMRVYSFCCLALGMAWTTLKTSHVTAISTVH
jgi:hypothetical protein